MAVTLTRRISNENAEHRERNEAVRALRAQADKFLYQHEMKKTIEEQENLLLRQGMVEKLIVEDGVCKGVITNTGAEYRSKSVIITTGTYLRGKIILGELAYESTRTICSLLCSCPTTCRS